MAEQEKSDVSKREEEILAFWQEHDIYAKSLRKQSPKGDFVFYDGPPFATGLPHSGSLLSSVSKDLIPRYKTMRGYNVRRRWGWDTHGLPIESLVEKKLGLKNKKEILAIGIEKFNETARAMVLEYVADWKRYVERVGRWVDFDNSYKTMDATFMESVWWGIKQIHNAGRLYEGRKVLMYCPHCETPLAKAEIAMDNTYKDVTEEAVTVEFRVVGQPATSFLAWTTTPWTLPGNVGLAVGPDIDYVVVEKQDEGTGPLVRFIVAKARLGAVFGEGAEYRIVEEKKGSELVGLQYEPLYEIQKVANYEGKKWQVLPADFVNTEDGTGIVHTAVIYGEDDYALGLKEALPMVPILNPNGTYNDDAPDFLRGKYIKKAEAEIKDDLAARGLLFARADNTHSYPHCYRCGTALIYNAVSSWFINIQEVKDRMLAENEKITWMPAHLKEGRFKHNIETAPDWTISRNRFWASPLPIWKDAQGKVTVIGSLDELKERTKKSGNRYFAMRHGEARSNLERFVSAGVDDPFPLTEGGRAVVQQAAVELEAKKIDLIVVSPFVRTRETAEMVRVHLHLDPSAVIIEPRLAEYNHGVFDGKALDVWASAFPNPIDRYEKGPEQGESLLELKRRTGAVLYELEEKYAGKNILIISHGETLWMLFGAAVAADKQACEALRTDYFDLAEIKEIPFVPLPHNRDYELDFHLPYIDEVSLVNEKGEALTRIPEVVDCWVESGSMPFAEYHYPFENKDVFEKRSPADFISEYIGQTRAWFYYLHAISTEIFNKAAFLNVITTGTILAGDGNKLSKSKNNYTDPYALFDAYGADAFRYYLMSSVVMQAEDLTFRDEEVKEVHNRVVAMLRNVHSFYGLYKHEADVAYEGKKSPYLLDSWILARLAEVTANATESFDRYDAIRATRPMRDFIDDLSTWYVRRSRDRIKKDDIEDKQFALATLRHVLREFATLIAPVMPFIAEEIFQDVSSGGDPESVHLASWPETKAGMFDAFTGAHQKGAVLIADMQRVRTYASEALMLRQKVGIKVRQPLASLSVPGTLPAELAHILAEEVNVKEIRMNAPEMTLDTLLTPELVREGDVRDFARAVAEARKSAGLSARDRVSISVEAGGAELLAGASIPGTSRFTFDAPSDTTYRATLSTGELGFNLTVDAT